jgi:hypothetical protein
VPPDAQAAESSPLGAARVRRRLTLEEAAARAGLGVEDVRSLEEGRIYRFPSVNEAIAATLVYATSLGLSEREARQLAGLPVGPYRWSLRRWVAVAAFAVALASLGWFAVVPELRGGDQAESGSSLVEAKLPPPWEVRVDVFNGTEVPNAATLLANEVGGPLAYRIGTVENADRLDYVQTRVYYPPGSEAIAERLADALDVQTTALPSGKDPNRLIVIVGSDRAG